MAEHKKGAVAYYLIIALILGAITYVEFAIVEYKDAITFLNTFWTFAWLAILSVVKFALVVAIYMHLRDDDPIYTSFFSSGMVIAMGTFIALSFLFTVRSVNDARTVNAQAVHEAEMASHGEEEAHGDEHAELEPEKTLAEYSKTPSPKNQAAFASISLPAAPVAEYSLRLPGLAATAAAMQEAATAEAGSTEADSTEASVEVEIPEAPVSEESTTVTEEVAPETAEVEAPVVEEAIEETAEAVAEEAPAAAEEAVEAVVDFDWQELGATTYNTNCLSCHQAQGQGIPAAFPPLAGHIPNLYNAEGGREYIINVVLYGLMGAIEIDGQAYNGVMSPWAAILSDEQIAATLNHELMSWGNDALVVDFSPILPEEVAALRGAGLAPMDVLSLRPE